MWVAWNCEDVGWEERKYRGLIERKLWKTEHVFHILLFFPTFAFYFPLQACYCVGNLSNCNIFEML